MAEEKEMAEEKGIAEEGGSEISTSRLVNQCHLLYFRTLRTLFWAFAETFPLSSACLHEMFNILPTGEFMAWAP